MNRILRLPPLLIFLFCSLATVAQPISINPAGPTSRTPIDVHVWVEACFEAPASVQVIGSTIKVQFNNTTFCDPPQILPHTVRVPGLLRAGLYAVEVRTNSSSAVRTLPFIVRHGEPQAFTAHPFAVPTTQSAPLTVRLVAAEPLCTVGGTCRVEVDGVEAMDERVDDEGNVWFTAPPHAPGLVSVRVDNGPRSTVVPNALYYFSRSAPPEISVFERILFPVLTEIAGLNGSLFRTETAMSNPKRWLVENYNELVPFVCVDYPCGERLTPGEFVKLTGGEYPHGVMLLAPRSEAPELAFALRARDVSRKAEGFGTEIPVVRESEMFLNEDIALLGVPTSPGYRVKLRIYSFTPSSARVRLQRAGGGQYVGLKRNCSGNACASTPFYAELDLPVGHPRENVIVEPEAHALTWAFITVTNNVTQQITTITPQAKGGH